MTEISFQAGGLLAGPAKPVAVFIMSTGTAPHFSKFRIEKLLIKHPELSRLLPAFSDFN
jgi:hypothetical protein